jgi:hypothetical protein
MEPPTPGHLFLNTSKTMRLAIRDDAPSLKKKLVPCNVDIWQLLDFLLILWCSQIGNDPWECLAKFGYELNMK